MHVHFGVELLHPEWHESVGCIGTFDGVHLGHQAVIRRAVEVARSRGVPAVLATFDRHPAAVLAPDQCPPAIASLQSNLRHFEELGVSLSVVLSFDRRLSETSAPEFFSSVLVDKLRAGSMVVGHDFAFGKGREGTPHWLQARIDTEIVPPLQVSGARVSSSAIRSAVAEGDLATVSRLLGRDFEMPGIVVAGQRLGRTLGFPTINLARSIRQVLPADGVYAGHCETPHGTFPAAISVGVRPSIDDQPTIEAYLLEYPGDELYGQPVVLSFRRRMRQQAHFESLDDLKVQIASDVLEVSRVLEM